jgi:hypothetical protein
MTKKYTPVTDPIEVEEILAKAGGLDTPFPLKPNGHLWVDSEELKLWRAGRDSRLPDV